MLSVVVTFTAGLLVSTCLRPVVFSLLVPSGQQRRSACPGCARTVAAARVRVLRDTWLGRCRNCGIRLGPPRASLEVATATTFAFIAWSGSGGWFAAAQYWLAVCGVALAFVDAAVQRLPDALTVPAVVGVLALLAAASVADEQGNYVRALGAACAVGAASLVVALLGSGWGLGDTKLLPAVGALLGWISWAALFWGVFAGFFLCSLVGVVLVASGRASRKQHIAFGPFMLTGALAVSLLAA